MLWEGVRRGRVRTVGLLRARGPIRRRPRFLVSRQCQVL